MISIINAIISSMANVLTATLSLLPQSPFQFVLGIDNAWIEAMCWLFPFASAVAHLQVYVLAVAVYYAIRIVLRWIKASAA